MLVVIDEAHNVCPAEPEDRLDALATDYAVRIAAEGRKFGLYLLVSTQRPQKVHPNVVTQCDNLVLMRLNSLADAALRARRVLLRPAGPAGARAGVRAGRGAGRRQDLPVGRAAAVRAPRAEEGGADVPADWANLKRV